MNYPHSDTLRKPLTRHARAVPVVSTLHITEEDGAYLSEGSTAGCWTCGHPRNPLVMASLSEGAGHLVNTNWREIDITSVSVHLEEILDAFRELGYPWIILDRDGDVIEGLTTFDW